MNISYSSLDLYKRSQLQFYFQYVLKAEPTNKAHQAYGRAGSAVHRAIEEYLLRKTNRLKQFWNEEKVDEEIGINGVQLSYEKYQKMFLQVLPLLDNFEKDISTEEKFEFKFHGMVIKGFKDLVVRNVNRGGSTERIFDWKTDSTSSYEKHKSQRLFYSWAHWKEFGIIPETRWIYLQTGEIHKDYFTSFELEEFEQELISYIDEIQKKGSDISQYEAGDWKNPFNVYSTLCAEELEHRVNLTKQTITIRITGNFCRFDDSVDQRLLEGIDFATRFDEKNKYYMQQAVKKKARGRINLNDVGTVHLLNMKQRAFPIGLLNRVKKIINDYAEYYEKDVDLQIIDCRDHEILEKKYEYPAVKTEKELRPYQIEAMKIFLDKQYGILSMATGSGKTFTAAKIIQSTQSKCLWICDRRELLKQAKEEIEEQLGIKVGTISGKTCETDKIITVATVQTLKNKLSELKQFLYECNMVIVDEYHKSAAQSFQKVFAYLPNTKYRLGLTATPFRDDGHTPILFSILDEIIYEITSKELIEHGYLVKPKITFFELISDSIYDKRQSYADDYKENIVDSEIRNELICTLTKKYQNENKKILILTKQITHGHKLSKELNCNQLTGKTKKEDRDHMFDGFKSNKGGCLVLTHSIGSEGLDIPSLDVIINAAANAGDVKSIQIIGRVLRNFQGKSNALYIDFIDSGYHTEKHSHYRMQALRKQGHEIEVVKWIL